MLISAAIVSKAGIVFCSRQLPEALNNDIIKHAKNFIYALSIADDDIEFPYIETTNLRYIYKESGDLYWLVVTKLESEMFTDIHLLGKFVCTIMEYGLSETNSLTLTEEQKELFYRHLWRPWDDDTNCTQCQRPYDTPEYWEREFDNRLQFLSTIRDGHLDDSDVDYFNRLIAESWAISAKLSPKWGHLARIGSFRSSTNCLAHGQNADDDEDDSFDSDSDSFKDKSISEEAIIDGCRLKCRFEDLRIEIGRIQDPYLRLFAKRNLLENCEFNGENDEQQIGSAPLYKDTMNVTGQSEQSLFFDN